MQPHDAYFSALASLQRRQVRFACIGTYGLWLRYPEKLREYQLRDCDIVAFPPENNLQNCLNVLQEEGWALTVWGRPLPSNWDQEFLAGKFYVRALKEGIIIDITYECAAISWKAFALEQSDEQGLPVASDHHIFLLKRAKGETLFQDFIKTWNFDLPT